MKIQTLLALSLLWVSGQVSAIPIDYTFSGELDCTDPICGAYTGMITIDNEQTGTGAFDYTYTDASIMFADGATASDASGTLYVDTTGSSQQQVSLGWKMTADITIQLYWVFPESTFDESSITSLLDALMDPTLHVFGTGINLSDVNASSYGGTLSELIPVDTTVPEPSILALLSLGLVGIGFTRRKMKI